MDLCPKKGIQRKKATPQQFQAFGFQPTLFSDAEEERQRRRVNLADDPSNRAMVQIDLHLLPPEILLEILSRLPITSLIHFRTTSHAGYDLITDPRLPLMFRNGVSDSDPCLILFNYNSPVSWALQLYFVDRVGCSRRVWKIDPPQHSKVHNLVGSCNGLLCLSLIGGLSVSQSLLIYNPFVGDAVRVPPAHRFVNQREVFGFGFHPRSGEFKVVSIVTGVDRAVRVFTIGTTKWRNKGAPPPQLAYGIGPPEALVEGSLHWVTVVGMEGDGPIFGIISFELADEVFEEIPHPPCQLFVSRRYRLSVLNGCLWAVRLVENGHFDIWAMKQYHVKESWVKQFSFDPSFADGWPSDSRIFPELICALKNGEILLQYNNSSLVSYDPVENRFKTLQMSGLPNWFQALPFLPSLFSAKATMNLPVLCKQEREEKRKERARSDGDCPHHRSEVQVFTIGTTEWRKKGASPFLFESKRPEALVEGSQHWAPPSLGYPCIISFELAEEAFRKSHCLVLDFTLQVIIFVCLMGVYLLLDSSMVANWTSG
ncbi:hypothetical protein SLEP1_g25805 [Rubroshorea leprosula]|uniref:F-box domain-containing protein n=1 Tax=Rubroshorea leprosula TaxID=152421 RepID=A0AAV5JKD7_9ROSI|nr:hypothetical protein SLEP1_g25805 [Rubroshorea leprosula]